jgi:hypothetical protein
LTVKLPSGNDTAGSCCFVLPTAFAVFVVFPVFAVMPSFTSCTGLAGLFSFAALTGLAALAGLLSGLFSSLPAVLALRTVFFSSGG